MSILLVFAFFVSLQLKLFSIYFFKFIDFSYILKKNFSFGEKDYSYFFSLYLMRLEYSKCIALSELFLENTNISQNEITLYSSLGFIYNEISFFAAAEYYYLEAIFRSPNDTDLIINLVKLYRNSGHKIKSKLWLDKLLVLDPSFSVPSNLID